jgi:hypothetical protein
MNKLFTLLFSFSLILVNAQDRIPADLSDLQFNINILEPSLSVEKRLSDKQSLTFAAGLTQVTGEDINDDFAYGISPSISASFRNYYPRKKVKKELRPNSGNYIGLVAGYRFSTIADNLDIGNFESEDAFFMGPVWGIQRNYKSGIHLGLSLGGGFQTGKNTDFSFSGVGSFELGFVISSK